MSPQKKLILRRNALFRQQLASSMPCCQTAPFHRRSLSLILPDDTADSDNSTTESSVQLPPPAEH